MNWQEYEAWLQQPEQKVLWTLRDEDKRNAYNYCGPNRCVNPFSLTYYREMYDEYEKRDDSVDINHRDAWMNDELAGIQDVLTAVGRSRRQSGDRVAVLDDFNWKVVGIDREMAFMHEAVYMEGQPSEEIPLRYEGCDYDYTEDIRYLPRSETRVDQYLNESLPG